MTQPNNLPTFLVEGQDGLEVTLLDTRTDPPTSVTVDLDADLFGPFHASAESGGIEYELSDLHALPPHEHIDFVCGGDLDEEVLEEVRANVFRFLLDERKRTSPHA